MRSRKHDLAADLDLSDLDLAAGDEGGRGLLGGLFFTLTLPVRLAGGLVGLVVVAAVGLVRALMIPVRLAVALTTAVVKLASDLVYGIWRAVLLAFGAVFGLVALVLKAVTAIVGGALRVVWTLLGGPFRALVWLFSLGKLSGARKSKKAAEKRATGDAVVELEG